MAAIRAIIVPVAPAPAALRQDQLDGHHLSDHPSRDSPEKAQVVTPYKPLVPTKVDRIDAACFPGCRPAR